VSNGNYDQNYTGSGGSTPANPATVTGTSGCASLTGATVTVTYGSAIPANTTVTAVSPVGNSVSISNPLQGAGVKTGDTIQLSTLASPPCVTIAGGINSQFGMNFNKSCSNSPTEFFIQYNGIWGAWGAATAYGLDELFPGGDYLGNQNGGFGSVAPVFPIGLMLSNSGNFNTPGPERALDSGPAASTATYSLPGDVRLNSTPVPGANLAWIDTTLFSTTLSGAVTQGVTTSVSVAACPSPALAANTRIVDITTTNVNNAYLGLLTSCSGTTLTFVSAVANSGASSDTINFVRQQAAGIVQDVIPVISSCGGGTPSIATGSNNIAGQFTMGTGSPTACTITFSHPYPNHAFCTVTPASSGGAAITGGDYLSTMSASSFTWTLGTGTSSLVFDYTCGWN